MSGGDLCNVFFSEEEIEGGGQMSGGDLCNVFFSEEEIEAAVEATRKIVAAFLEAADTIIRELYTILKKFGFSNYRELLSFVESLCYKPHKPRRPFSVINEKKRRRIKNKDRVLRWFAMVAHPEPRRMARKRAETARRATKARFPINYPQAVENLVETSERAFFVLFLIFLNFGKIL